MWVRLEMWHDYSVCLDLARSEIRENWVGVRFSRDCGKPHTHMRRREGARSLRDGARWNGLDGRKFWMGRVGGRELVRGRPCAECRAGHGAGWVFLSRGFLHAFGVEKASTAQSERSAQRSLCTVGVLECRAAGRFRARPSDLVGSRSVLSRRPVRKWSYRRTAGGAGLISNASDCLPLPP